ncbi:hypothetical protein J2Z79_002633 [Symbiobacterium terraclitae]|uniref:Uncharacterized protein n=1 Tax=Symbiobacterium terraclitae TaxID=557451 RepID=A0ABS4JUJ3_9FIRM|nr:hypothetical protein [Symbiobacterium terraclitae]MBP2019208.1 hypothetical protein [Symbiobacterium terraclitae]
MIIVTWLRCCRFWSGPNGVPRRGGVGPLMVVNWRLLVGRCDEAEYVAIPLPDALATTIDQKAQDEPETHVRDLPQFSGKCMAFLPVN